MSTLSASSARTTRPRRLPERVRARGRDELRRRAPCRPRRRRRRLVAAQPPPRARGRGARGRCPRARREADGSDTRRRGGARDCRRGSGPGGGGGLRLELLAADGLGEGGARARAPRADHVCHGLHVQLPHRSLLGQERIRGRRRGRVRCGGGNRDVGPVGCRRRLPLRAAVPPARPRALARPERARGRARPCGLARQRGRPRHPGLGRARGRGDRIVQRPGTRALGQAARLRPPHRRRGRRAHARFRPRAGATAAREGQEESGVAHPRARSAGRSGRLRVHLRRMRAVSRRRLPRP